MFQSRAIEVWKRVVRSIHDYIWGVCLHNFSFLLYMFQSRAIEVWKRVVGSIHGYIWVYGYAIDVDTMWRIMLPLCHIHIHLRGEIRVD
jgi:hypothetical protein